MIHHSAVVGRGLVVGDWVDFEIGVRNDKKSGKLKVA
jgi:hypothetical protein